MIVYKITNNINNKIYIGLTTCSLEYRWAKHLAEGRNVDNKKHLYKAMRKYGLENFSIEQIDSTEDFKELGRLEREYIKNMNLRIQAKDTILLLVENLINGMQILLQNLLMMKLFKLEKYMLCVS